MKQAKSRERESMDLKSVIRNIPDFPVPGIQFKDITTLLKIPDAYRQAIDEIVESIQDLGADTVVGPEARGFIICAPVAYAAGLRFVPARKPGKLPAAVSRYEYALEYGTDALEIHKDAIQKGHKVVIADDLLATGGTALAVAKLVESMGGEVVAMRFMIELTDLKGRETLKGYDVRSLVQY